jgi:hypothetical protein
MTGFNEPRNVYNGNFSLRGNDVHDRRFELINFSPSASTKNVKGLTLAWNDDGKDKTMDFSLPFYCKNGNYNPEFEFIAPNLDVGSK